MPSVVHGPIIKKEVEMDKERKVKKSVALARIVHAIKNGSGNATTNDGRHLDGHVDGGGWHTDAWQG